MNPRSAPSAHKGFSGLGQSGNSAGKGATLDPASSNADIRFCTAPYWGQE
jgi:hypothetical protein